METKFSPSPLGGVVLALFTTVKIFASIGYASNPPKADREAILSMAGEFEVIFQFEEKVSLQDDYKIKEGYYEEAYESVFVVEDTGDRIALQHILRVGNVVVKHWKQLWTWEDTRIVEFQGDHFWEVREISEEEAAGTWSQLVTQVDDSPRYESYGVWNHDGGFARWESGPTNRPLPRREHTKRDDYNILRAVNVHALTPYGWVHDQDNLKLVLGDDGKVEKYLAWEKGLNFYDRIDEPTFERITEYWENTKDFWALVSKYWDGLEGESDGYSIARIVNEKPMMMALGEVAKAINEEEIETPSYEEIAAIIDPYIIQ